MMICEAGGLSEEMSLVNVVVVVTGEGGKCQPYNSIRSLNEPKTIPGVTEDTVVSYYNIDNTQHNTTPHCGSNL